MLTDYLVKVNVFLVVFCLLGLIIIISLIYKINSVNEKIDDDIQNIETKFPKPKDCPACDTKCPDMKCPDMKCPENKECPQCSPINNKEPEPLNDNNKSCPSVQDIISGIFPGRNPKVVDGGRYFSIDPYNTYDGLSTSNFYEHKYDFPIQKILRPDPPLRSFNIGGQELINNSKENSYIDTSKGKKMLKKNIPVAYNYNSLINYQESNSRNMNSVIDQKMSSEVDSLNGMGDMRDRDNVVDSDGLGAVNISGRHSLSLDNTDAYRNNYSDSDGGDSEETNNEAEG
jgi:hypothetical protein